MYESAVAIIDALAKTGPDVTPDELASLCRKYRKPDRSFWTKPELLEVLEHTYRHDTNYERLKGVLKKKPIRSLSGITSITVLTKPFPCPGRCVYCPVDVRMPKSYIASEPGARRAGLLGFDPYRQVFRRLEAYSETGHPISKIELIVLGGSWSAYPREYQIWFIKRLFDALNDFGLRESQESDSYPTEWNDRITRGETYNAHINASKYVVDAHDETATLDELRAVQQVNETARSRCVGLSLETRPDLVDVDECLNLRSLGATKIQIGIQSLDDHVLKLNKRGHNVARTEKAMRLLRQFGFKIHAHWMPNLYGANWEGDISDFDRLFANPAIRPDELKVYPTVLIQDTELETIAGKGLWHAYAEHDLNRVLTHVLTNTPEYCRLTRIIRDIPSTEILAGNKKGNLRQIVEETIDVALMRDIRSREVRSEVIPVADLMLDDIRYETAASVEHFVQFIRPDDRKIAGFVRLSLPTEPAPLDELRTAAIIREVHVYGQSIGVGQRAPALTGVGQRDPALIGVGHQEDATQHRGLGSLLVNQACAIASDAGFENIAIISAVGTRKYYEKLGFTGGDLYQHKSL